MSSNVPLEVCIDTANTGLDAIKRAPIVEHDTGIKCLRIQDVSQSKDFENWGFTEVTPENFKKFQLKKDDILIARTGGSIGVNRYISADLQAVYNNGLIRIRVDTEKYYPKFVYYLLRTDSFKQHINSIAFSTAAQPNMKIRDFLRFEFLDLPLETQIQIADNLSDIDDKIELNRQTNQTLEHMAQAIFKSWFVDFEPTRAKAQVRAHIAQGRLPLSDGTFGPEASLPPEFTQAEADRLVERAAMAAISGKSVSELDKLPAETLEQLKTTAALFPDALVDSELGEIPEGWGIESIYDIADVIYGAPFKSKLFNDDGEGLPLVRIRDLKHERPGVCTPEVHKKGYLIQNGDLLVGMDGEFRPYIWGGNEAWMNQRVCTFKPKKGLSSALVREFITQQLRFFELTAVATTVIHLGKGDIDGFTYIEPNNNLLTICSDVLEPIFKRIVANKVECIALEETRDVLLPKLLSGELEVREMV